MTQQPISSVNGDKITLSLHGELRSYANDKAGKRQAILDALNTLEPLITGTDRYLPGHEALQLVAMIMYPAGIHTDEAYRLVCSITDKACAYLGYGPEVELSPPTVPFTARGAYRKRVPPLDPEFVNQELNRARTSTTLPQQEMAATILWNQAGYEVYGRHWQELTLSEQTIIQMQIDAIAEAAGWQKEQRSSRDIYTKPLPVDDSSAPRYLVEMLQRENGRPVLRSSVVYELQYGAYGRSFLNSELSPTLQRLAVEVLSAYGYDPEPDNGEYWPKPLAINLPSVEDMQTQLASLVPVATELGLGLRLADIATLVLEQAQAASSWQLEQLVQKGPVSQALQRLGYQTNLTWCQPYHFQPPGSDSQPLPMILKAVRVRQDTSRKISLAAGLAVFTPALAVDDDAETLVYLEMVGAKESVKANWAALMGGNRVHWLGRQRVQLEGMKQHIKVQATLPCGWVSQVLLHKQVSLKLMNPEQPFYLLDDGTQPIPPLFYPMLNKSQALPLLPAWALYLWENGRLQRLIHLLNEGDGQGYAVWRVLPSPAEWQAVVQHGVQSGELYLNG